MMPPVRHGAFGLRQGIVNDPKFEVRNIGPYPDDLESRPYRSVTNYVPSLDWPDLFVSEVIEWHQIPVDSRPVTLSDHRLHNDFDIHIQGLRQWFDAFATCVSSSIHVYEWPKLSAIADGPTLSFPLVFACERSFTTSARSGSRH
jgi:hypothetical protein